MQTGFQPVAHYAALFESAMLKEAHRTLVSHRNLYGKLMQAEIVLGIVGNETHRLDAVAASALLGSNENAYPRTQVERREIIEVDHADALPRRRFYHQSQLTVGIYVGRIGSDIVFNLMARIWRRITPVLPHLRVVIPLEDCVDVAHLQRSQTHSLGFQ